MSVSRELPSNAFLSDFRWYRRWRGGHWEQWTFECGSQLFDLWLRVDCCSKGLGLRPRGPTLGGCVCENYRWR